VVTVDAFSDNLVVVRDHFDRCGVLDLCFKKYGYQLLLKGCPSFASLAETAYRAPPELLSRSAETVMAQQWPQTWVWFSWE
jgi:hypothetical protein